MKIRSIQMIVLELDDEHGTRVEVDNRFDYVAVEGTFQVLTDGQKEFATDVFHAVEAIVKLLNKLPEEKAGN